jgi:hypothetical protein
MIFFAEGYLKPGVRVIPVCYLPNLSSTLSAVDKIIECRPGLRAFKKGTVFCVLHLDEQSLLAITAVHHFLLKLWPGIHVNG